MAQSKWEIEPRRVKIPSTIVVTKPSLALVVSWWILIAAGALLPVGLLVLTVLFGLGIVHGRS